MPSPLGACITRACWVSAFGRLERRSEELSIQEYFRTRIPAGVASLRR